MAKIRKDLVGSVLVENPKGGDPLVLVAGDKVPEGITLGDHVLAKKSTDETSTGESTPPAGNSGSEAHTPDGGLTVPPLSGAGSSAAAWHEYAKAAVEKAGLNIEIPADANRADVIEALKGANIPVE